MALVYTTLVSMTDIADRRPSPRTSSSSAWRWRGMCGRPVVGKRVSAANILVDDETADELLDWRADYNALRYEPAKLPEGVDASLLQPISLPGSAVLIRTLKVLKHSQTRT